MTAATCWTDDLGDEVVLPARPRRLVSLVPSLTELLWWWHLADAVVGRTEWCTAPPGAFPRARVVRGTKNPDVDAIVDLGPELVIASEEENRRHDVNRLREAGVPVWVTRVRTLEEAAGSLERLADALGVPSAGVDTATGLRRAAAGAPSDRLRVAVPVWRGLAPGDADGDEGWMVVGPATIGADVLAVSGFAVWPDDPEARYPVVSAQEITAAGVDAVLLPDEPYAFGTDDRAAFPGTPVRLVDGTGLFWWGPRTPSTVGDLRRLARHLRRRTRRR